MTTYNGYVKDLSEETKRQNEIDAIRSILKDYPNNQYWMLRLDNLLNGEDGSDTSMSAQLNDAGYGSQGVL